jgi:hypothetical protein
VVGSASHVNFPRLRAGSYSFLHLNCRRRHERRIRRKSIVLDLELPTCALPIRHKLLFTPSIPFPTTTADVAQESPPLVEKYDNQYHRADGYHVGLAVFWLAPVAVTLVCVSLPSGTGADGREVEVWVGVRRGREETPVKTVVSCAVCAGVG